MKPLDRKGLTPSVGNKREFEKQDGVAGFYVGLGGFRNSREWRREDW